MFVGGFLLESGKHRRAAEFSARTVEKPHLAKAILHELSRGVTVFKLNGGFSASGEDAQEILLCVVTHLEIAKIKNLINRIDETAFVVVHHVSDASGGLIKKPAAH